MAEAEDLCRTAADLVGGDRAKSYGPKRPNHQKIADFWNTYLNNRAHPTDEISAFDVAMLMALLKVARMAGGAGTPDNFVDAIGYIGIAGELSEDELD